MRALLLILLALLCLPEAWAQTPQRRALLVAVGAYDRSDGGFSPLNAANDTLLLRAALQQQGFASGDIRVLADAAATRRGMEAAIRTHLLAAARPGDILFLHYSGHGQQISDDDDREEPDGLDEALALYDAPATARRGYRGEAHFRDDDLGALLDELRRAVAPNGSVVVSIDACHSGSGTRGDDLPVRGGAPPLILTSTPLDRSAEAGSGVGEAALANGEGLAPLVVFSAARYDQVAREVHEASEGRVVGALTLALSRALGSIPPGTTYRELFRRVEAEMAQLVPGQQPQLEGSADTQVFSGQTVEQQPFYAIREARSPTVLRLDGGTLVGLMTGTEFEVHPAGTTDPARSTALAYGRITRANALLAEAEVAPALRSPEAATDYRVFVTKPAYGDLRLTVCLDDALPAAHRTALTQRLDALGLVQRVATNADLLIRPGPAGDIQVITAATAEVVESAAGAPPAVAGQVAARLDEYARAQFFLQLDRMRDRRLRTTFEVLPARYTWNGNTQSYDAELLDPAAFTSAGGQLVFRAGDTYALRVQNQGPTGAYLTVLSIRPTTGRVEQLFPRTEHAASDNFAAAQSTFEVPLGFRVGSPGQEVLLVIATRERIDFSPVLASRGAVRNTGHPLEELLALSYAEGGAFTSRSEGVAGKANATVRSITFTVVE